MKLRITNIFNERHTFGGFCRQITSTYENIMRPELVMEIERKRREANYMQLENFRTTLRGKMQGSLKTSVDKVRKMYEEVIILFENTDDDYKKELDGYYDTWAGIGDKFNDVIDVIADVGSGAGQAIVDFGIGIGSLLSGIGKILGWLVLQIPVFEECGLIPETLEEKWEQDLKETWTGIKAILSNPNNAMEAIDQSVADTVDEKGVAYSIGYVAPDIIAAIFADKGLGLLKEIK